MKDNQLKDLMKTGEINGLDPEKIKQLKEEKNEQNSKSSSKNSVHINN